MKKCIPFFFPLALIFFTFVLILLNNFQQLGQSLYSNDLNAWLLPAVAPLRNQGAPYRSFWAIEPPGLMLMTTLWASVSTSLWWFHCLNILLEIGICWAYWHVLKKTFPFLVSAVVYGASLLLFFSSPVQSMFLPSEMNGLFFSMLGLFAVTRKGKLTWRAFWASVAFALAGQMKEVFAFSLLALVPLYMKAGLSNWKDMLRAVLATIVGVGVVVALLMGYLLATKSLGAYEEVHASKVAAFHITDLNMLFQNAYHAAQFPLDRFMYLRYQLIIVVAIAIGFGWWAIVLSQKISLSKTKAAVLSIKFELPKHAFAQAVWVCYWVGMWLGYTAQNRYGNKYDIAMIFSTHVLIAILVLSIVIGIFSILRLFRFLPTFFVGEYSKILVWGGVLALLIVPYKAFIFSIVEEAQDFHVHAYVQKWQNLEKPELYAFATEIANHSQPADCIQGVYGWGIANIYLYSHRTACTRFFIPNIVTPDQIPEYRQTLLRRPPKVLYYSLAGADLDTTHFENTVFNYTWVIKNCYEQDPKFAEIYFPKKALNDDAALRICIKGALLSAHQL